MGIFYAVASLAGLMLTLIGAIVGAHGAMLSKRDIDARVSSQGRWHDEAPDWVRADYERASHSLRNSLWLIAAGTTLQIAGVAGPLIFPG